MDLPDHLGKLLERLVDLHESKGRDEFYLNQSVNGWQMVYIGGPSFEVTFVDVQELADLRLLRLKPTGNNTYRGSPTLEGIRLFRNDQKSRAANWLRITPDEPLGINPYPKDSRAHLQFIEASRQAKEKLALFTAKTLSSLPPENASSEEFQKWRVDATAGQFSIKMCAILAAFATNHENLVSCEIAIDRLAQATLEVAGRLVPIRGGSKSAFLSELRLKILEYREYSIGQALRQLRIGKGADSDEPREPITQTTPSNSGLTEGSGHLGDEPTPPSRDDGEDPHEPSNPPDTDCPHRAMVKAYFDEIFKKTKKRLTKKDFWTAAGYSSRTQFERWERCAPNATKAAHTNFTRVLQEKPHLK